jgi:hypothetical protein
MNKTTTPVSGSNDGNDDEGKRDQKTTHVQRPDLLTKEKFVGHSDDLEGYIYSIVSSKGGVQFACTTEEIARYAGDKYSTVGSYIRFAVLTMTAQVPVRLTAPVGVETPPVVDAVDQAIFGEEIRQFVKEKAAIVAAMKGLYSLIWGQCSESLRSKLKANSGHFVISAAADSLALLTAIRSEMTGFQKRHYLPHSVHSIMREFYQISQSKDRTNQEYYNEFNNLVAAVDEYGLTIGRHPTIYREVLEEIAVDHVNPTNDGIQEAEHMSKERYLAVPFILGADRIRYGIMIEEIENKDLRNRDQSSKVGSYPTTVADAETGKPSKPSGKQEKSMEVALATRGDTRDIVCKRCGDRDHRSPNCRAPNHKAETYKATQTGNTGFSQLVSASVNWDSIEAADEANNWSFLSEGSSQGTEHRSDGTTVPHKKMALSTSNNGLPASWILLDNQSTCDIFADPKLLKNIRKVDGSMQLSTQAGSTTTNLVGNVPGYGTVWFHPNSLANIIVLTDII